MSDEHLITYRLIRELAQNNTLSELAARAAISTLASHAIADITGVPVETQADIAWAVSRAGALEGLDV